MIRLLSAVALSCALLATSSCTGDSARAVGYPWNLPNGFPSPPVPTDNPMSAEKALLGRYLFYDTRMSRNGLSSCGSCHEQAHAFAAPATRAVGTTGEMHRRNAMTLTNAAYSSAYGWSNPNLRTIEQFVLVPLYGQDPVELGLADRDAEILDRLRRDERYPPMFRAAFPDDAEPFTMRNVERALATFVRTLISANSPYDRAQRGDRGAMSESAHRGEALFFGERFECYHCHGGTNFSDATTRAGARFLDLGYHNTALYNLDGAGAYPSRDQGLLEITQQPADMGKYRTPTLRNIELTGPYFHDGSAATLDEVISHYASGGRTITSGPDAGNGAASPLRDSLVLGFTLTDADRADLVAFLRSLTDTDFVRDVRFSDPFRNAHGVTPLDCPTESLDSCDGTPPSYATDIAPLIASRCASCHTDAAPGALWRLSDYTALSIAAPAIRRRVGACEMPPASGTPITADQRRLLLRWVACGAPQN